MLILKTPFEFLSRFCCFDGFIVSFSTIICFFLLAFYFGGFAGILHKKNLCRFGLYGILRLHPNAIYCTHIYTGDNTMAEEICFVSVRCRVCCTPPSRSLRHRLSRAIHRHERFTEMLYVYQGAGQYIAGGYSCPIRTGDILLYNQGDLHEVTSSLQHEIGTFCFGFSICSSTGLRKGISPRRKTGLCVRRWTRSTICKHSAN